MKSERKLKVFTTIMLILPLLFSGCAERDSESLSSSVNVKSSEEFRFPDEDELDDEIKVGTTFGNGKETIYSIFILRESIDIKSRDPYRFTCKVRLVEGVDDLFRDPMHEPITFEGKKYSEYKFYPRDNGEPYFKCKSAYFNPEGKESKAKPVKKDIIASKVYSFVTERS